MPTFDIGIVTHLSRLKRSSAMATKIGANVVMSDDGGLGGRANHIATLEWLLFDSRADWIVILEDDCLPCPNFAYELTQALRVAPANIVSLYLGRAKPVQWQEQIAKVIAANVSWLVSDYLLHGVGYAIRRGLAEKLLTSKEDPFALRRKHLPIDEGITECALALGERIAYTRPSLIDHDFTLPSTDPDPNWVQARKLYVEESPDIPNSIERKAWMFGTRRWDSTFREIESPMMVPIGKKRK